MTGAQTFIPVRIAPANMILMARIKTFSHGKTRTGAFKSARGTRRPRSGDAIGPFQWAKTNSHGKTRTGSPGEGGGSGAEGRTVLPLKAEPSTRLRKKTQRAGGHDFPHASAPGIGAPAGNSGGPRILTILPVRRCRTCIGQSHALM